MRSPKDEPAIACTQMLISSMGFGTTWDVDAVAAMVSMQMPAGGKIFRS